MRKTILTVCGLLVLAAAAPATADLCGNCRNKMVITVIGKCSRCSGTTASSAYKICHKCSKATGKCQLCGAALAGAKRPPRRIDPPKRKAPPPVEVKAADWKQIADSSNAFAMKLYAKLAADKASSDKNLFFSPSSIHTALAMTYAGARGETEKQMAAGLRLPVRKDVADGMITKDGKCIRLGPTFWPQKRLHPAYKGLLAHLKPGKRAGYKLHVANALWGQQGYKWLPPFLKTTKDNYGAGLREVDFIRATEKSRNTINAWVEDQTNDKIKELLKKAESSTAPGGE